jgi:predicted ATPase/DNA-binding SARP family transcriptional activator
MAETGIGEPWRIEMLGGLRLRRGPRIITSFQSRQTGLLLAYLVCHSARAHPREELIDRLWPEASPEVSRHRLSQALSSLRKLLHTSPSAPAADPSAPVPDGRADVGRPTPGSAPCPLPLVTDNASVRINPEVIDTDVAGFERAMRAAEASSAAGRRGEEEEHLERAVALYRGEFLAGYQQELYEDWVRPERLRLAGAYLRSLRRLIRGYYEAEKLSRALDHAHRAVAAVRLDLPNHLDHVQQVYRDLITLNLKAGKPHAARSAYQDLRQILADLDEVPTARTRELAARLARAFQKKETEERAPDEETAHGTPPPPDSAPLATGATLPSAGDTSEAAPPAEPIPGNLLPAPLTRFFGRTEELAWLQERLLPGTAPRRLVTLTGPAGTGKTRLALEAASRLAKPYGGAVWFAPLAEVSEPGQIAEAILDAMRLERLPGVDSMKRLARELSRRPALLVLDNVEHLLPNGAAVTRELLAAAGKLTLLVTSRRRLRLAGEETLAVGPLPTPPPGETVRPDRDTLIAFPAVQLFVDRARAVQPDYALTPEGGAAVARLCRRLDGIPLAIELAAAWVPGLAPEEMLRQFRLESLRSPMQDTVARHRTLRAAIEWSYRLLAAETRAFLARLSVFRGGFCRQAAARVTETPEAVALDELMQLLDCSFLVAESHGETRRFRMLETIREFTEEKPREEGATDSCRARHRDWFLELAEEGTEALLGGDQETWLDRFEREHDNLRAALEWSLQANPEPALRLSIALCRFWEVRGYLGEGRRFLERSLRAAEAQEVPVPPRLRARALNRAGILARDQGDYAAARSCYERSLAVFQELKDERDVLYQLNNLADVARWQGNDEEATRLVRQSLDLYGQVGDRAGTAASLHVRGEIERGAGRFEEALRSMRESLSLFRDVGDREGIADTLQGVAGVHADAGRAAAAVRLFAAVTSLRAASGSPLAPNVAEGHDRLLKTLRDHLGDDAFEFAWAVGETLSWEEAVTEALTDEPAL